MTKKEFFFPTRPPPFTLFAYVTQGHRELKIALLSSCDVKLKAHWSGDTCCWGTRCLFYFIWQSRHPACNTTSICLCKGTFHYSKLFGIWWCTCDCNKEILISYDMVVLCFHWCYTFLTFLGRLGVQICAVNSELFEPFMTKFMCYCKKLSI